MTTFVSLSGPARTPSPKPLPRCLCAIARDVQKYWPNVYYGARPYLDAMMCLEFITDMYGQDSARSIVTYFLANARTWRGEDAKRIKAELNLLLKG